MTGRAALMLGVLIVLSGCRPSSANVELVVRRWLLCEECSEGERAAVIALGRAAVKPLGAALRGPPAQGRSNIARQAEAAWAGTPGRTTSSAEYVRRYVDNYVATYQSRAAEALALLDSLGGRLLLIEALQNDSLYRSDVLRTIVGSAQVVVSAVDTSLQVAPFDSLVPVDPAVLAEYLGAGGPAKVGGIRVSFIVESGGGQVSDTMQRTDSAGMASVSWRMGSGIDSVNILKAVVLGQVLRFRAIGHSAAIP